MATDLIRLTIKYKDTSNNQFRNVFHFQTMGGVSAEVADMEAMVSDFTTVLCPLLPTSVSAWGWEAHKWDAGANKWQPFAKGAYEDTGEAVGDVLPYQAAAVVLGYTSAAKTIAKKWIGPLTEGHQAAGTLTAPALALLEAFCTIYTNIWTGTSVSYQPGSWSKLKGFHAIISGLCSAIVGSQRRRKPGVGI